MAAILLKSKSMGSELAPRADINRLADSFFGGLDPLTQDAYRRALGRFAKFLGVKTPTELAKTLFSGGPGPANQAVLDYRNHLKGQGKAPATVNLYLAAIRSFVKFAKTIGLVLWELSVKGLPAETYRDTRGPGRAGVEKLLIAAASRPGITASRDLALIRLMWDLGLRVRETVRLNVEDVDFTNSCIWILGKKRLQKEMLELPQSTLEALMAWIGERRTGPVFVSLTKKGEMRKDCRLTTRGVQYIICRIGAICGIRTRPHGVRHAAITDLLEITNGNIPMAKEFSRHVKTDTLMLYNDKRVNLGGQAAKMVAGRIGINGGHGKNGSNGGNGRNGKNGRSSDIPVRRDTPSIRSVGNHGGNGGNGGS